MKKIKILLTVGILCLVGTIKAEECTKIPDCFGSDHSGSMSGFVKHTSAKNDLGQQDEKKFDVTCTAHFGVPELTATDLTVAEFWIDCPDQIIREPELKYSIVGEKLFLKKADGTVNQSLGAVGTVANGKINIDIKKTQKNVGVLQFNKFSPWAACYSPDGVVRHDLDQHYVLQVEKIQNGYSVSREFMSEGSEVYMTSVPTSVKNCSDLKNYFSKDRLISSTVRKVSGQLTK